MSRISQWQEYKEEVCEQLRSGKTASELSRAYPDISYKTIYTWFRAVKALEPQLEKGLGEPQTSHRATVEVLPPQSNVSPIGTSGGISDYALARRTLRNIAKDSNESGGVRVQASLGLLRMVSMRYELPKHILDEIEESSINEERDRITTASPAELSRRYREALG